MSKLNFPELHAALDHARLLHANGYQRAGKWSLGQALKHLSTTMEMSRTGFVGFKAPRGMWLVGGFMLRWVLRFGMPKGVSAPPILVFGDHVSDAEELAGFEREIAAFEAHTGALAPSPIFGVQGKPVWRRIHLRHAEHHLGFLRPT